MDKYFDPETLKILEDDTKSTGEKLFVISKYFSPLFYNNSDREPTDFEKHEALIFSCFSTFKVLFTSGYNLSAETQTQLLKQLFPAAPEEVKTQMVLSEEFPKFYLNREALYFKETKKMQNENYDFAIILDKLYLAPLSSSFKIISSPPNIIEYTKLLNVFTAGLKQYNLAIIKAIELLKNSE